MSGPSLSLTPDPPASIKEGSKVINPDWVKHLACRLGLENSVDSDQTAPLAAV